MLWGAKVAFVGPFLGEHGHMSYGILVHTVHDIRGTHKHKYLLRVLILLFFKSVYIFLILKAHCVCVCTEIHRSPRHSVCVRV
jgi:hypothetical protein